MIGPWIGAALFAIGLVLSLDPLAQLFEGLWVRGIDQGWATLIGAVVGLSAVAWQTRRGFSHLIASQKNQAELDRQARTHQSILERQQLKWRKQQEAKELAASLRGELIAAYYALLRLQQSTTIVAAICDAMIEEKFSASFPFKFPTFHCSVYEANAHRIGIIGADLAADIAQIFSALVFRSEDAEFGSYDAGFYKALQQGLRKSIADTMDDVLHVVRRLRAFEFGEEDPRILAHHREEREEKRKSEKLVMSSEG